MKMHKFRNIAGLMGVLSLLAQAAPGQAAWTRIWGSASNDYGHAVAVDKGNGIYVTGYTDGSFDGQTNPGGGAFLTKYTADGVRQWSRIWGPTNGASASGVAVDGNTNIFVAGESYGNFDGQTKNDSAFEASLLTKFAADGTKQWTRIWGGTNSSYAAAVAVDGSTNIYVTGTTYDTFDGQTGPGTGFLSKFTAAGVRLWSRIWGSGTKDWPAAVTVDSSGNNIYVAGQTAGSFDGQIVPVGGYSSFLTKFDASGSRQWTRFVVPVTGTNEVASSVAVDTNNNIYVGGYNWSARKATLTQFTAGGSQTWSRLCSQPYGDGMTADNSGAVYMIGASAYWPTNNGLLLTKYSSSGLEQTLAKIPCGTNDGASALALSSAGMLYIAGDTRGSLSNQPTSTGRDNFLIAYNANSWSGATDLGGGWKRSPWFGDYAEMGNNWIWHSQHGFEYCSPDNTPASVFFWDLAGLGWLWTSSTTYPCLYRFSDGAWLWYQKGSSSPRWFFNFHTGLWTWHY